MRKLEALIAELCPNGIKTTALKNVAIIKRGERVVKRDLLATGRHPVYQNCLTPMGYYNISNFPANTPFIIVGGAAGEIGYSDVDFWAADDCVCLSGNKNILNRYVFHFLLSRKKYIKSNVRKASIPRLSRAVIENLSIPIPPLEIQREIVRILDSFTLLTAELTAELIARKKQYEFYRDKLLTSNQNIKKVKLGAVCTFVRGPFGGALKKEIFQSNGYAVYEQQHAIYRNLDFRYYIDKNKFSELKRFAVNSGDMIVSCSGTIGKTFVIPKNAPEGVINQALLKLTPNNDLNVFYLQYFFENSISKVLNGVARGGAIKNVPSVSELKSIEIPLPPLDVQKKLVNVLDNFEAICTDLNIGLPAEIEARQKQYEYYRDLLLTFAETGNTILTDRQTDRVKRN